MVGRLGTKPPPSGDRIKRRRDDHVLTSHSQVPDGHTRDKVLNVGKRDGAVATSVWPEQVTVTRCKWMSNYKAKYDPLYIVICMWAPLTVPGETVTFGT